MPRKAQTNSSDSGRDQTPSQRFGRYSLVIGLCALVGLGWISMLTYSPTEYGSAWQVPPAPVRNWAGKVGAFVAHTLRYWLGAGTYMALVFGSVAAGVLIVGGRVGDWVWRLAGVLLLVAATSTGLYLRDPAGVQSVTEGTAGVLGGSVGQLLLNQFDVKGAWLVVVAAGFLGVMFAADKLVLSLPGLARRAAGRAVQMRQAAVERRREALAAAAPVIKPTRATAEALGETRPDVRAVREKLAKAAQADKAAAAPTAERPKAAVRQTPPKPAKARAAKDASLEMDLPSQALLIEAETGYMESQQEVADLKQQILQQTLNDFGVAAEVVGFQTGPVITMFELSLSPGVKVAQVASLATDIARSLAVSGVRVVPHLSGRDTIGIEVPNDDKEIVRIKQLMELAPEAADELHLPLYLGKDAAGDAIVADLAAMPHMLIAGTTGSGKSVCINSIIMSLLLTRNAKDVRLILADPKMVEMAAFDGLPHLLCPIINDMRRAEDILEWAAIKMDERYDLLKEAGVRNIAGYNHLTRDELYERMGATEDEEKARIPKHMDYYVIIIDELADLIMTSSKEVETYIIRIAQKARAVGIHLILATQRPSVNVVTGLIKSNMPCRISFQVASRQESRIVLDQNGAEILLGKGDMLVMQPGTSHVIRAQGTFVDESEINGVVKSLKTPDGAPSFNTELMQLSSKPVGDDGEALSGEKDDLFNKAVEVVLTAQRGSVSLLQRRLQIGYGRASRIVDQMAEAGLLGEYKGSQARECTMTLDEWQSFQGSVSADLSGASAADGTPTSV